MWSIWSHIGVGRDHHVHSEQILGSHEIFSSKSRTSCYILTYGNLRVLCHVYFAGLWLTTAKRAASFAKVVSVQNKCTPNAH